jgi:hypothetical protein
VPTEFLSTDLALQCLHSMIFGTATQLMTRQHQIFLLFNLRNWRNFFSKFALNNSPKTLALHLMKHDKLPA